MPPSNPRLAIIGGGPAGLTLGLLFYKQNIPFTIFELRQNLQMKNYPSLREC